MTTRRPTAARLLSTVTLTTLALPMALAVATPAHAAQSGRASLASGAEQPAAARRFMRVKEAVDVKSGPEANYYTFMKLAPGDLVEVLGDRRNGFATIRTHGPRFASGFALLRVRDNESFSIRPGTQRTATGRSVRTGEAGTRLQLQYPNIEGTDLIGSSWRTIRGVPRGTIVTFFGDPIPGDGTTMYRVPLPNDASGFIPLDALEDAAEAEATDFLAWEADPAAWIARRRADAEQRERDRRAAELAAERQAQAEAEAARQATIAPPAGESTGDESTTDESATDAEVTDEGSESAVPVNTEERTAEPVTNPPAATDTNGETDADPAGEEAPADEETTESTSDTVASMDPAERLEALEEAFGLLQKEDVRRVEVRPLAALYREFAADVTESSPDDAVWATARARQLDLWARLQDQRERIAALRRDVDQADEALGEAADEIRARLGFSAIGRLATSRIFDGDKLPRLYRLEALDTGRTLAYVREAENLALASRIGSVLGLFGERSYDPGLQLDVIDAIRVERVRIGDDETGVTAESDDEASADG